VDVDDDDDDDNNNNNNNNNNLFSVPQSYTHVSLRLLSD